jgi:hypothetical protein
MGFWQFADQHPWFALGMVVCVSIAFATIGKAIAKTFRRRSPQPEKIDTLP